MARTTHHPARASNMENEPPTRLPATATHAIDGSTPVAVMSPRTSPPKTVAMPILKRNALPAAPMLHVSAISRKTAV